MQLSFSTRGWQPLNWDELPELARTMHFQGIELYDLQKQPALLGPGGPFHRLLCAATVRTLRERRLAIPCLDSSCDISSGDCREPLLLLMDTAHALHCPFVSVEAVLGEEEAAFAALRALVPEAEARQLRLLLKTKGLFADTARLRRLLDDFACDQLGALWDVHHSCMRQGERPEVSIQNLGAYVCHVHLRDEDDQGYTLPGEGALPMTEVMDALNSIDYGGYLSLIWKESWGEAPLERDVALPYYVNYMRRFDPSHGRRRELPANHDGSGLYVWKKDTLIGETFPQVLDRMVEEFPDQLAFKYTTLDYTRSYREFRDDVDRFARALVSLGVRRGSKVAIWATNVPEWFITFWAVTKLGAILVSMNTAYKIHEAEYLLRQSDTHTLVMIDHCLDSDYGAIMAELCPELAAAQPGQPAHCSRLPFLRNVITVGFSMPGCLRFSQAMERAALVPQETVQRMAAAIRPDDVCNMQYTSGTTGFPKGVMLTHRNVVNNGKCIGDRMDLSTADRMMIQVPMFHCFGMVLSMTAAMTHGTTSCPLPYFSAKASLACIRQERITCFNGVPTMFIAMFHHPDYRNTDFSHMRTGIMAGAGCPPELMRRAARPDEMNMRGIVSVYGQTECAPGNTMSAWDDPLDQRCGTVGRALPHIECRILDPATGLEAPDGVNGEFCARGYNTMKGYYKMPQASRETVDDDGWLHSGDLACRDENGCYRITGRLKDMIIRGGENIYPKELEEFLLTHPAVQDAQVIGVPDERYGEEALACVILKEGAVCTEAELLDFTKSRLARHKVPRYLEFVERFPMNAAGKILKYQMRQDAIRRYGLDKTKQEV